jgi:hypothetical protein
VAGNSALLPAITAAGMARHPPPSVGQPGVLAKSRLSQTLHIHMAAVRGVLVRAQDGLKGAHAGREGGLVQRYTSGAE